MNELVGRRYLFLFSVIVPIYNTERYLEEAIESVISQDVGFEENIQLILVNNGSTDGSGEICKKYLERYPENVVYIKLSENQRPNGGRNAGIPHIEGKYVNFLDSDDVWESDAFRKAYCFLEDYREDIDVAACRMKFFEGREGYHPLDYKFKSDRIVDIFQDFDCVQLHAASCFIRRDAMLGHEFHMGIHAGEDARFIAEIILEKQRYGVLRSAVYNYRKREDETSELQNARSSPKYYSTDLVDHLLYLAQLSQQKFGEVILYVQWHIMYVLQFRLKEAVSETLDEQAFAAYVALLRKCLSVVEDFIIMKQKNIYKEYKLHAFQLKYGEMWRDMLRNSHGTIYFDNLKIMELGNDRYLLQIFSIEQTGDELELEGYVNIPLEEDSYQIFAKDGKSKHFPEYFSLGESADTHSLRKVILVRRGIRFRMPLHDHSDIRFFIQHKNILTSIRPTYKDGAKISYKTDESSFQGEKFLIQWKGRGIGAEMMTKANQG